MGITNSNLSLQKPKDVEQGDKVTPFNPKKDLSRQGSEKSYRTGLDTKEFDVKERGKLPKEFKVSDLELAKKLESSESFESITDWLLETGEPDQDYDHEFFDEIVRQLEREGFSGAKHREFDKYQGVYLNVPGVDTFWVSEVFFTGKAKGEDEGGQVFQYEKGTETEHWILSPESSPEERLEVIRYSSGEVDAKELIDYVKSKKS
jgi:hypothetical protein